MGFGGGKAKTVYVPAPQKAADTSAAEEADRKKKKDRRALEQSYGQALQAAQRYMPVYAIVFVIIEFVR